MIRPTDEFFVFVSHEKTFHKAMIRAFGKAPWQLNRVSLNILHGMASMVKGVKAVNPFMVFMEQIEKNGTIKVWIEENK